MSGFFIVLTLIAMLAALGALVIGLGAMARGGEFNRKHGNKLMQARVYLQGAALILFVIAVLAAAAG